jgi:uncharacterized membrane protein
MNLAHLHIVLNHVPVLGTVLALALLILSIVKKNESWNKLSLQILVVMALLVLPTYLSGNAAQWLIQKQEVPQPGLIETHENSAMITLFLMTITGTLAWFGLWQYRRFSRPGPWNSMAVLILSILTTAVILRTANLGGKISHPEVRYGAAIEEAGGGWREPVSLFANSESWVWPASETLHFIGMTLLFGVALAVNLRMLGLMKSIPFSALHRLLPLGILGFVINVCTGMVFFIASPEMYFLNAGFEWKIFLIILAGITVVYFTIFEQPWAVGPDKEAPLMAKVVAVSTTSLLLGAMYFGRMLPFLRN